MKSVLLTIAAAITLTQTARAEMRIGADRIYTVLKCHAAVATPDRGISVVITQGGFAGLTEMTVTHYYLGQSSEQKYVVTQEMPQQMGSPMRYVGTGVRLTVNFTTTPMNDGGHYAVLQRDSINGHYMPEELSCHTIYHTM